VRAAEIPGYELGRSLSRSAHAETWRARDAKGREVVIKCYRPGAGSETLLTFTSRAGAHAALGHPNVAPLRDRGQAGDLLYAVRDYYSGGSLETVAPSLGADDKLRVGVEIARALEHAHQRGLVHGALKPANVVFESHEKPVLADFALVPAAQQTGFEPPQDGATLTTDSRADQYSFAALLSWLLIGRVADSKETISSDPTLDKALKRAMAPQAADRFRRLDELVHSLEAAAGSKQPDAEGSNVRVEKIARTLRVQVTGKLTPQAVETCAREVGRAIEESGAFAIGYLFGAQGSCSSTAIETLADLHRRHRATLRKVGFVSDTPQARGASVLIGSRVEGLAWKTFSSVDVMDAWLREGTGG
jgi:serine/threonine protein kinase